MKFGKDLEQYKHPGWEDQYINYRELKNILRQLEEEGAVKDEVDGEFFQALEDDLEKASWATPLWPGLSPTTAVTHQVLQKSRLSCAAGEPRLP